MPGELFKRRILARRRRILRQADAQFVEVLRPAGDEIEYRKFGDSGNHLLWGERRVGNLAQG